MKHPALSVIAGPNGSGKSTLTSSIWFEGNANLIDPDTLARSIDPIRPARAAIPAARQTILRCRALLASRVSFALETTLAGHGAITIMREARKAGYRIVLVYVALKDPELHIERVRLRVSRGGHDIPDVDIRRRYARSLIRTLKLSVSPTRQLCSTIRVSILYGCSFSRTGLSSGDRNCCRNGLSGCTGLPSQRREDALSRQRHADLSVLIP